VDLRRIERIARERLIDQRGALDREPGYAYYHGQRTARLALALAAEAGLEADGDVVYAAGLLHDVAKGLGLGEPHHEIGARLARKMLQGTCEPDELDRICQVVREHPLRGKPNGYAAETLLVQDADLIDHAGAIGVWRDIYWAAIKDRVIDDAVGVFEERARADQWGRYREMANLDAAIVALTRREAFERRFYAQLRREREGGL
jgi:uncharacterized protein